MSKVIKFTESEMIEIIKRKLNERMEKPPLGQILKNQIDDAIDIVQSISDRHVKSHNKKEEIKSLIKEIVSMQKKLKKLLDQGEVNND